MLFYWEKFVMIQEFNSVFLVIYFKIERPFFHIYIYIYIYI